MAKLIPDQLSMLAQMSSESSPSVTSSQELQDGHTPSDLQDGKTKDKSGRAAARASRLVLQDKVKELTIHGTFGRTFFDSLEAVAPASSWVSKLQERLGMVGSTESDLIWKVKATPSKASIFRLAPQTRRISGPDCIGWRTPNTRDGMQSGYADMEKLANRWERGKQVQLCDQVRMEHSAWTTPCSDDTGMRTKKYSQGGTALSMQAGFTATWPTPNAEDAKAGQSQLPTRQQSSLPRTVGAMMQDAKTWPTPKAVDGNMGFSNQEMAMKEMNRDGAGTNLPTTVSATWPTPNHTVVDAKPNPPITSHRKPTDPQISTADIAVHLHSGTTQSGSTAQTEKRGALNPTFVCWLMGFPQEWESCAPTAMPSCRRSRQK